MLKTTLGFVGCTTEDDHYISKHVGYYRSPVDKKKGLTGRALYQYVCGRCGNKEAIARGSSLKTPGNTQGCEKCHSKRETINRHQNDKDFATGMCRFYIASVYSGKYIKPGISNDYNYRSKMGNFYNPYYDKSKSSKQNKAMGNVDLSYEQCLYLSEDMQRAWVFTAEQILLKATEIYKPKDKLPNEMIEAKWPGQSELRECRMDYKIIKSGFLDLIKLIREEDNNWYKVYKKQYGKYNLFH